MMKNRPNGSCCFVFSVKKEAYPLSTVPQAIIYTKIRSGLISESLLNNRYILSRRNGRGSDAICYHMPTAHCCLCKDGGLNGISETGWGWGWVEIHNTVLTGEHFSHINDVYGDIQIIEYYYWSAHVQHFSFLFQHEILISLAILLDFLSRTGYSKQLFFINVHSQTFLVMTLANSCYCLLLTYF